MVDYPLAVAFLVGLFGTVHCLAMCSGIAGALTVAVDRRSLTGRASLPLFSLAYSLGRVASYTLAGAVTGALGGALVAATAPYGGPAVQWLAAGFLAALGLYIAGVLPALARIERLGVPLWQRLEPLGRRLLPVRRLPQAALFGMVWGWLPCGLVYTALAYTVAAGGALEGALFMAAFGAGTLPSMVGAGVAAGALHRLTRRPWVRRGAGAAIVAMAVATLAFPMHAGH